MINSPRRANLHDVAGDLGDGGGDERQVRARETRPSRDLARPSAGRPRRPRPGRPGPAPRRRLGRAGRRSSSARLSCAQKSQPAGGRWRRAPLPAPVAGGQREQDRPAAVGRRLGPLRRAGTRRGAGRGSGSAGRRRRPGWNPGPRRGRRCPSPRPRARGGAPGPPVRQPAQGEVDQRSVHPTDRLVLRARISSPGSTSRCAFCRARWSPLCRRGDQVPGGDDGVRSERVALHPGPGRHHSGQRLLDDVVNLCRVPDAAATTRRITGTRSAIGSWPFGGGTAPRPRHPLSPSSPPRTPALWPQTGLSAGTMGLDEAGPLLQISVAVCGCRTSVLECWKNGPR